MRKETHTHIHTREKKYPIVVYIKYFLSFLVLVYFIAFMLHDRPTNDLYVFLLSLKCCINKEMMML